MLKNYFKIAVRNLLKNKGFSAINIIGLSVGLATCLLIMLYVIDELGYDNYHAKADRIYRVDADIKFGGTNFVLAVAPDPMGAALVKDYPQIEQFVRFRGYGGFLVKKGNENVAENRVIYADSTLFEVFTLPMVAGDPKTALTAPDNIVITESTAKKYFSTSDAVGKTLVINDTDNYKVSAILKDIPKRSHFNFDFFVPLSASGESRQNNWVSTNFNTYIVLRSGTNPKSIESKFDEVLKKYVGPQLKEILNISMEDFGKSGNYLRYSLTPVKDIHLYSNKSGELGVNSSIQYVYIFSVIAIFILLIACVNFMNLSTARSSGRAKEVGIRKVMGSLRKNLILQFLSESILISFISLLLALLIAFLLLPYFNQLSAKDLSIGFLAKPWLLPGLLVVTIIVGLLAGSYPAFYLSAFQPIKVLKGSLSAGFKSGWLRSSLVVFQFWISIVLIIGTVVIYKQLNYIQSKNIGYNREQVLVLNNTSALGSAAETFKHEISKLTGVDKVTMSSYLPTSGSRMDEPFFPEPSLNQDKAVSMQHWQVDADYVPTLKMQIVQGRNFSTDFKTDSNSVIINETAAKLFGFGNAVDKVLYKLVNITSREAKTYRIVGVVKDFNFNTLHAPVSALALRLGNANDQTAIRVQSENVSALINSIQNKYKALAPSQPFSYSFMDDDFKAQYDSEQRTGKIFITFAILAIVIACLGLFGLVTYAAEQRTKEIGIRKVLGATVTNILTMLSSSFLKLVIISAVIAFPVAWWALNLWLRDFAYRINISWWIFIFAGALALTIALITIIIQAIKAALANPIKSLRTE